MRDNNVRSLETLRKTCYNAGLLPIFLGIFVIFIDTVNRDFIHVLIGILIFVYGYALVKIAAKLKKVLRDEGVLDLDK